MINIKSILHEITRDGFMYKVFENNKHINIYVHDLSGAYIQTITINK